MQRDDDSGTGTGTEGLDAKVQTGYSGAGAWTKSRTSEDIIKVHRYQMSELVKELQSSSSLAGGGSGTRDQLRGPQYAFLGLNLDPLVNSLIHTYQRLMDSYREYVEKIKLDDSRKDLQQQVKKLERIAEEMEIRLYGNKYEESRSNGESKSTGGLKKNYLNLCNEMRQAAVSSATLKTRIGDVDAGIEDQHKLYRTTANGEGTKIQERIIEMQRDRDDLKNKLYRLNVSMRFAVPLQKVWKSRLDENEEKYKAFQRRLIEAKVKADQSVYECSKEINELLALAVPNLEALKQDEQRYSQAFRKLESRNLRGTENFIAAIQTAPDEEAGLRKDFDPLRRNPLEKLKVLGEKANDQIEQEIEQINNGTYQF